MNYEEQIVGLKRIASNLQKRVTYLESEKDIILKILLEQSNDANQKLGRLADHLKTVYSVINPIEAKIFPAARAARRKANAVAALRAVAEKPGRKKH